MRRALVIAFGVAVATLALGVFVRRQAIAAQVLASVRAAVVRATGLEFGYDDVGFSLLRRSVRIDGVELRHPREGRFVRIERLDAVPSLGVLFGRGGSIGALTVEGGRVDLVFRDGKLVNGPAPGAQQAPRAEPSELAIQGDVALTRVGVHVSHDVLGEVDLPSVDLDVALTRLREAGDDRLRTHVLAGLLSRRGALHGRLAQCLGPTLGRMEARVEYVDRLRVRVGAARFEIGDQSAVVNDVLLPLTGTDRQGVVDLSTSVTLDALHCLLPAAPQLRGRASVDLHGAVNVDHVLALAAGQRQALPAFQAHARVRGSGVALEVAIPDGQFQEPGETSPPLRAFRYLFGDDIDLDLDADPSGARVTRFEAHHSEATITLADPARPLLFRMQDGFFLDGALHIQDLRLERLLRNIAVTDFAKVIWTISGTATVHGELHRFGMPEDPAHPPLRVGLDMDTRHFAILRDYHQMPPQTPVIGIREAHIEGALEVDPRFVRFRNIHGAFGPGHRSRVEVDLVRLCANGVAVPVTDTARGHVPAFHDLPASAAAVRPENGPPSAPVQGDAITRARANVARLVRDGRDAHGESGCWYGRGEDFGPTGSQFLLRGGRGQGVHLEDIAEIAGIPIAGLADFDVQGGGPYPDPVIFGQAHLKDFRFNDLPLGDIDTPPGSAWIYRQIRVDAPVLVAHAGRSYFTATDSFLDFGQYSLHTGTHVRSDRAELRDYYRMFKFEHDPVWEPYDGGTMPRCRPDDTDERTVCVESPADGGDDPRRPPAPSWSRAGHIDVDVDYVLGRPGDRPGGVMRVDFTGRNLTLRTQGETARNVDTHFTYLWLDRDLGARGARMSVDYARGVLGGGRFEVGGGLEWGGILHFSGDVRDVQLGALASGARYNLRGVLAGSGVVEGPSDRQQWSIGARVDDMVVGPRSLGAVQLAIRATPGEDAMAWGPASRTPRRETHARPPEPHYFLHAEALGGLVRLDGSLRVPWRESSWTDVDGHTHADLDRAWGDSVVTARAEVTRTMDVLPWLPTSLAAQLGLGGVARARAMVDVERVVLSEPLAGDARVVVDDLEVSAEGKSLSLAPGQRFAACLHGGRYWVDPAAAVGRDACHQTPQSSAEATRGGADARPRVDLMALGSIPVHVRGGGAVDGGLDLGVDTAFDLGQLHALAPSIRSARGPANLHVALSGTAARPRLAGALRIEGGEVDPGFLPWPVDAIDLLVRLDGSAFVFDTARARVGPGSIDLGGGRFELDGRSPGRLDVPVRVRSFQWTPQPGIEVALNADARVTWSRGSGLPRMEGEVALGRVRYTRPVNLTSDLSGNVRLGGGDSGTERYDPDDDRLALALRVRTTEPIHVANNLIDAEVEILPTDPPFRIQGTDGRPVVFGALGIPRGRVFFRGSEFDIRRGRVEFANPERIAPNFDVLALTDIRRGSTASRSDQWRVELHAYGTPDNFGLDMTSDPPLSREDIALLLTLRMTRAEFEQVTRTAGGGATSGGLLALELASNAIANATGLDRTLRAGTLPIDEFRVGSAYSPAAQRSVPQVAVGRRLTEGVRLSAMVNAAETRNEVRATVDMQLGERTTLQVGYDNMNGTSGTANSSSALQIPNLGADVRWRLEIE